MKFVIACVVSAVGVFFAVRPKRSQRLFNSLNTEFPKPMTMCISGQAYLKISGRGTIFPPVTLPKCWPDFFEFEPTVWCVKFLSKSWMLTNAISLQYSGVCALFLWFLMWSSRAFVHGSKNLHCCLVFQEPHSEHTSQRVRRFLASVAFPLHVLLRLQVC